MATPSATPPLLLDPIVREKPWGGDRLRSALGKEGPQGALLGESWEVVSLGGLSNPIREGPGAGGTLEELLKGAGPDLLGIPPSDGSLPLLFKYIDARGRLSLQVHPDDEVALRQTGRPQGKTEAWRVIQAEEGASIRLGLRPGVDRKTFEEALARGTSLDCLNRHPARVGDTYFVPAGCIHTVGGGVLFAEIQQASDITYRFSDWGRAQRSPGPTGSRTVDPEIAFEAADLTMQGPFLWVPKVSRHGEILREVFRSKAFNLEVFEGSGRWEGTRGGSFEIISVARGEADLVTEGGGASLHPGDTALLPKGKAPLTLEMRGAVLIRSAPAAGAS